MKKKLKNKKANIYLVAQYFFLFFNFWKSTRQNFYD